MSRILNLKEKICEAPEKVLCESELLSMLNNWTIMLQRISMAKEKVSAMGYSVTQRLNLIGGASGSNTVSDKVVDYCARKEKLVNDVQTMEHLAHAVLIAISNASLNKCEKDILTHIMDGGKMLSFSHDRGIHKTSVYRIRNRAVKKVCIEINKVKK